MSGAGASGSGGDFHRRCDADKRALAECQERFHTLFDQLVDAKRRVDHAAAKVRANNASSSRDSAPAFKLARGIHGGPCPSDSGSDSPSESEESGGGAVAASAPAAAAAESQAATQRVTDRAFKTAKLAHKKWTGYHHALSDIYKNDPNAFDMVRARRKLQEFEVIMREYHDSRKVLPLALRRVK